jgi:hypothetical protein
MYEQFLTVPYFHSRGLRRMLMPGAVAALALALCTVAAVSRAEAAGCAGALSCHAAGAVLGAPTLDGTNGPSEPAAPAPVLTGPGANALPPNGPVFTAPIVAASDDSDSLGLPAVVAADNSAPASGSGLPFLLTCSHQMTVNGDPSSCDLHNVPVSRVAPSISAYGWPSSSGTPSQAWTALANAAAANATKQTIAAPAAPNTGDEFSCYGTQDKIQVSWCLTHASLAR